MAWAMPLAWQLPRIAIEGPERVCASRERFRHAVAQDGADKVKALRARRGRSVRAKLWAKLRAKRRAGLERKTVAT